jgi:hypothetical protein
MAGEQQPVRDGAIELLVQPVEVAVQVHQAARLAVDAELRPSDRGRDVGCDRPPLPSELMKSTPLQPYIMSPRESGVRACEGMVTGPQNGSSRVAPAGVCTPAVGKKLGQLDSCRPSPSLA